MNNEMSWTWPSGDLGPLRQRREQGYVTAVFCGPGPWNKDGMRAERMYCYKKPSGSLKVMLVTRQRSTNETYFAPSNTFPKGYDDEGFKKLCAEYELNPKEFAPHSKSITTLISEAEAAKKARSKA